MTAVTRRDKPDPHHNTPAKRMTAAAGLFSKNHTVDANMSQDNESVE